MTECRLLNDAGISALASLALKNPKLFLDADPTVLAKGVKEQAQTEDIWGDALEITNEIEILNKISEGGPGTDAQYSRIVRQALSHLSADQGLDEYRWATINCFVLSNYVSVRWGSALPKDSKKLPNFVKMHWLNGGLVDARRANAIARLWWLGEFSDRASQHSDLHSADEFLDAMANNVNLYHQLLSRPNLLSRPKLVAAIYEVFLDGNNDYLSATKYANEMLESLNLRAAELSVDFMDLSELREVVEELKPPKER